MARNENEKYVPPEKVSFPSDKLRYVGYAAIICLATSGCSTLPASSDTADATSVSAGEEGLRRLTAAQISRLIVGKTIMPDAERIRLHAGPSSHRFERHGTVFVRGHHSSVRRRYRVTADQLCIEIDGDPSRLCDYFYQDPTGRYYRGNLAQHRVIEPILILE